MGNTAKATGNVIGFHGLCMQDSPTGVRHVKNVSAFPASINVASTFDRHLMLNHGTLMAAEFRSLGANVLLGPMMNGLRAQPDAGRNWEGQGADPFLTAESARLQVRGIQNQGVIAVAKHFVLNEQETFRTTSSSNVDDRTLHEVYLKPFQACIDEGAASVMCSYNLINQTYACENERAITEILKGEMGFRGFVMTDWWATNNTVDSAMAGSDMLMPGDTVPFGPLVWGPALHDAAKKNQSVSLASIDDMAIRILAAWYKVGQDDDQFPPISFDSFSNQSFSNQSVRENHNEHIRIIGAASSVLLKNARNTLPLGKSNIKLAVLGSDAGPGDSTSNDEVRCKNHACSDGTIALGWGSGAPDFPYIVTPLEAIQQRSREMSNVSVAFSLNDTDLALVKGLVKEVDVTIVFVSANSGEGSMNVNGNVGDRTAIGLKLWNGGDALIFEAAQFCTNVVVVIHAPGPVEMPWLYNPSVAAVFYAGFPGQESGNSIADVLFGDVNPSGRLPFSINQHLSDYSAIVKTDSTIPSGLNAVQVDYEEGLLIDYRYNDAKNITPLFEFGFGLSYTNFVYENFTLDYQSLAEKVSVTFSVKNIGSIDGHEVAQLYLGFPEYAKEPPKQLRDFDRKMVAAGSAVTFKLVVPAKEMQIWNTVSQKWIIPRGTFQIFIGASSRDIKWNGCFVL